MKRKRCVFEEETYDTDEETYENFKKVKKRKTYNYRKRKRENFENGFSFYDLMSIELAPKAKKVKRMYNGDFVNDYKVQIMEYRRKHEYNLNLIGKTYDSKIIQRNVTEIHRINNSILNRCEVERRVVRMDKMDIDETFKKKM